MFLDVYYALKLHNILFLATCNDVSYQIWKYTRNLLLTINIIQDIFSILEKQYFFFVILNYYFSTNDMELFNSLEIA